MIEVAENETPVTTVPELMQERHGIAPAGHADKVTARGRKMGEDGRVENQFFFRSGFHTGQQATGMEPRQDIKERRFETAVLDRSAVANRRSLMRRLAAGAPPI
jgi:hypothetical protein